MIIKTTTYLIKNIKTIFQDRTHTVIMNKDKIVGALISKEMFELLYKEGFFEKFGVDVNPSIDLNFSQSKEEVQEENESEEKLYINGFPPDYNHFE